MRPASRFAGGFLLAVITLVLFIGLALREARRRPLHDVRALHRLVRRIETGDFEEADPNVTHQPRVVSSEPCLCVAALDGQIVLPGRLGRLLAPFVKL